VGASLGNNDTTATGWPDPGPQHLAHGAEVQMLSPLHEVDDRPIVPVISHRKENIVAIVVALDHDLVAAPT
jgi:hypothetical protein